MSRPSACDAATRPRTSRRWPSTPVGQYLPREGTVTLSRTWWSEPRTAPLTGAETYAAERYSKTTGPASTSPRVSVAWEVRCPPNIVPGLRTEDRKVFKARPLSNARLGPSSTGGRRSVHYRTQLMAVVRVAWTQPGTAGAGGRAAAHGRGAGASGGEAAARSKLPRARGWPRCSTAQGDGADARRRYAHEGADRGRGRGHSERGRRPHRPAGAAVGDLRRGHPARDDHDHRDAHPALHRPPRRRGGARARGLPRSRTWASRWSPCARTRRAS